MNTKQSPHRQPSFRRRLLGLSTGMALAGSLHAQDNLEEVVVTAQKRQQAAMDVPMTVNVFSSRDIAKTGALNLSEVQDFIPGFDVGDGVTQANVAIRGISSTNISTGGDPSVATFYDEVYVPRAATTLSFSDTARIEVLKGPQGTLYGRNAVAGVVNIVPNQPGPKDEAFLRLRAGDYSLFRFEAMGNAAVTEEFFLRGNLLLNQRDGYVNNLAGGRDPGSQDNIGARLSGLWSPTDRTQLQFALDYDEVDNAPRGALGISEWAACPNDPFCGQLLNDVIDGEETRDMWAITGKLLHDINDNWSMKAIASYRDFETTNRQDEDGTAESDRYLDTDNIEDSDIAYAELQFSYTNDRVNAVFGANYSREDTFQIIPVNTNADSAMRAVSLGIAAELGIPIDNIWDPAQMAALLSAATGFTFTPESISAAGDVPYNTLDAMLPGVPVVGPSFSGQNWSEIYINEGDFENYGIYGDVEFQVNDRWTATLGLRYSWDEKTFSWRNPPNTMNDVRPGTDDLVFLPYAGYEQARTGTLVATDNWSQLTGRAVLNYQLSDDALTFLSYATGYKSGAFDSLDPRTSDNPIRPEESENIELGIKGDFFDRRLQTEFSLFNMTLDDRQRTVDSRPPGQAQAVPKVITGDQEFLGAEIILNWRTSDTTQLGFLTTWRETDSTWEPFFNAVGDLVEESDSTTTGTDYTGVFEWFPTVERGSLDLRLEYIFTENNDEEDVAVVTTDIPGFGEDRKLLNARIVWTNDDETWSVGLWGKNLLDNEVTSSIQDISTSTFGTPFVSIDPPRTYGIEAQYNWR